MKRNEFITASIVAVLLTPILSGQNAEAEDFRIKAEGAVMEYKRTVAGTQMEMGKMRSISDQVKELDAQIQTAQTRIEDINRVPTEWGPILIAIEIGADPNSNAEQMLRLLFENKTSLESQITDAFKEQETAHARKNDVPVEHLAAANALEYMINEK